MKERWQTCFWPILRTFGIHFLRDFRREVKCGRLIDSPLAKHDTERRPLLCCQLVSYQWLIKDTRGWLVMSVAVAVAVDAEGTKVTRFRFVQKRKKLNDNLLWAADATPTPTPTPTATATATLTLTTAVQSVYCLFLTDCRPPSLTRSLSLRLLACVVFVGFVCSSLLRLLLYNALLHAAHFTYFNQKCISYTALFSICISLLWLRQIAFGLVLFSCLLCTAILRGQGYNFLFLWWKVVRIIRVTFFFFCLFNAQ